MASLPRALASSLLVVLVTPTAWADGPETIAEPEADPSAVYGGEPSAVCGWPSTVALQGSCTGTLVHPEIVIYAQHCGGQYSSIQFGEDLNQPAKNVPTEFCRTYPGGGPGSGADFAFCKLAEPVLDVPIVPILMGCEVDLLQPGAEVTVVGYGNADDNLPYGIKREVVTTINNFEGEEIFIGGNGKDSCNGDSGGPVFIKVADGTWRVFGITSYGGQCGTGGYYSMMHKGMQWFETESGIDLTPCGDATGAWLPTEECKGFPMNPGTAGGSWPACNNDAVGGYSATCGGPAMMDEVPPTAVITMPTDGQVYEMPEGAMITITVDAQDAGSGIKDVRITVNGQDVPNGIDMAAPYELKAIFPTGEYDIGAVARDNADNEGAATPVHISVNPAPAGDGSAEGGDSDEGGGSGEGGESGEGGDPTEGPASSASDGSSATSPTGATGLNGDEDGGDEGCGCRSGQEPKASLLALVTLGLLARRRRR